MSLSKSTLGLVGIFTVSGVIHLVRPEFYEAIMPSWVPAHRKVILASGVAEILLAAGIVVPKTRGLAGWGSVALLVGVFPANVKMALDALKTDNTAFQAAAIARLPLQLPMIRTAIRLAREK